jgi:hypothetical protein
MYFRIALKVAAVVVEVEKKLKLAGPINTGNSSSEILGAEITGVVVVAALLMDVDQTSIGKSGAVPVAE